MRTEEPFFSPRDGFDFEACDQKLLLLFRGELRWKGRRLHGRPQRFELRTSLFLCHAVFETACGTDPEPFAIVYLLEFGRNEEVGSHERNGEIRLGIDAHASESRAHNAYDRKGDALDSNTLAQDRQITAVVPLPESVAEDGD